MCMGDMSMVCREMMNNPESLRQMLSPENMQAMVQMQQAMQQLQGTGLVPPAAGAGGGGGGLGGVHLLAYHMTPLSPASRVQFLCSPQMLPCCQRGRCQYSNNKQLVVTGS